jgi:hypothetical protein
MMKRSKGKHHKPRVRWVGPSFAFGALMAQLSAARELSAVTAAQLAEMAAQR